MPRKVCARGRDEQRRREERQRNEVSGKSLRQMPATGAQKQQAKAQKTLSSSRDSELAIRSGTIDMIEIQISENEPASGMRTGVHVEFGPLFATHHSYSEFSCSEWLFEYHNKRPEFNVLQQHIDDFIVDFEAREEKARQEREAAAAEEGWTVVTHHKGRKKTTDLESGISVGGVASAAVERKRKKQTTDSALNFYRFQRREARRNEILELQQRFEEDKKKIATLREARKFRPY